MPRIGLPSEKGQELNDQVGTEVSKNFLSLVVQVNGYENLKFTEKNCCNHLDKAQSLR